MDTVPAAAEPPRHGATMTTAPVPTRADSATSEAPSSRPEPRRARGRLLGLVMAQVRAEVSANLRTPEFMVGVVAIPVLLFAMFGIAARDASWPAGTNVGTFLMASFATYGVMSLAIFTFGVDIANERGRGWLRTLRATPMPPSVYFLGKLAMALLYALAIIATVFGVGVVGAGVRLDPGEWAAMVALLLAGTVAFSTFGFALAYLARPRAATAIGNLIFLPLGFLSGLFRPLTELPDVLADIAPYLPTHHFGRLVWAQIAPESDVVFATAGPEIPLAVSAAWLVGSFVVFGALALLGYRADRADRNG